MRLRQAQSAFLGTFPRYGLEAISLILISLLALLFASGKGGSTSMLPTLGSMALGAQRLLPSLQQIYSNWALIESRKSAVVDVLGLLDQPVQKVKSNPGYPVFQLVESLRFENVSFSYSQETTRVLNDINLEIRQGERIGLVGSTGSGKSTLVDILMGLLKPTTGKIIINGEDLYDLKEPERLSAWKATIAHVPQSIFMADCSIAENIAFGTPKDKINMDRVRQAAEQAQISSFVETSRDGYHTIVGERGVRMSGGQRQRIGIARAFYRNANLIILDEATSALDRETEQSVIAALENTSQDHTLIMIAHRLSTLEHCDRIIRLGNQSILEIGPPSLVLKSTS
jgi:ATP-binding cassette subfamily B protein